MWKEIVDEFSSEGFFDGMCELLEQSIKFFAAFILYLVSLIIFLYVYTVDLTIASVFGLINFWPVVFYALTYVLIILSCFWCCE